MKLQIIFFHVTQGVLFPLNLSCPKAIGCLSSEFFDEFTVFSETYPRDNLEISTQLLENTYAVCVEPILAEAVSECPAAIIELMLNTILAVERFYGFEIAKQLYVKVKTLRDNLEISNYQVSLSAARHKFDAIATYDFLFGVSGPPAAFQENSQSLGIFVYEYPIELEKLLTAAPVGCSSGQWGTESLFHRWLLSAGNPHRETDPSRANLFYVPVYATCAVVREHLDWELTWTRLYKPLFDWLTTQSSWKNLNGRDHIFLLADGQGLNIHPYYELMRNSILLMVEGTCPHWGERIEELSDITSCFNPFKDVIIPGHTDLMRVNEIKHHKAVMNDTRDQIFSWRGRSVFIDESYHDSHTRNSIVELFMDSNGTDVGGFSKTFLQSKVRSKFCLVPSGTSPWTNHLYESLIAGCVPVILSDDFELPFWDKIPWKQISIKWPESAVEHLYEHLASFNQTSLDIMIKHIKQISCWVDWWSKDSSCNPYLAIADQLRDKVNKLTYLNNQSGYWNTPSNIKVTQRQSRFHRRMRK